jgi:hypothetical protein
MNTLKIAAIALIAAGILGLVYGGFSYTRDTQQAQIGPIELTVKDKQAVNVPIWASVGVIALGGVLLVFGSKAR